MRTKCRSLTTISSKAGDWETCGSAVGTRDSGRTSTGRKEGGAELAGAEAGAGRRLSEGPAVGNPWRRPYSQLRKELTQI
jgi:hypothetical protein